MATTHAARRLHKRAANLKHEERPKCASCLFGKQTSQAKPGKRTTVVQERDGILSADKLHPGQRVFVDHFMCSTRGRKFKGQGINNPKKRARVQSKSKLYQGGCIFVDAATGHIDVEFQTFFSSEETIQAIKNYEDKCRDNGIIVQEYQFDNGSSFTSRSLRDYLEQKGQTSRFSGAGSHHQNGRAERGIRTIMGSARTMLLHTALHWPDVADATLWPMSVRQAVWIHNHLPPRKTGLSPHDL